MAHSSARLVSGSAKLVGANIFLMLAAYLALLGIARLTDVERFGRYVVVVAVLLWIERITAESFKHPLVRQITLGTWRGVKRMLLLQMCFGIGVMTLLYLFAPLVAQLLNNSRLTGPLQIAALDILPFAAYASGVAALTAHDRYGSNALAGCIYGASKLALMLWAAYAIGSVETLVLGMVGASLIAACFVWIVVHRSGVLEDMAKPSQDKAATALAHGYWQALGIVGGSGLLLAGDVWLVQAFSDSETAVGLYGAAHNLTKAMYMAGSAVMWPMIPAVSKAKGFRAAMDSEPQVKTLAVLLVFGLLFGLLLFAAGGGALLSLLFGAEFADGGRYLAPLALAHVCVTLALVASQLNYHCGRPLISSLIVVGGSVLFIALGATAAAVYGAYGVPWSLCVSGVIMLAALTASIRRSETS